MQFTREEEITGERVSVYEMQREIVDLIYFSEDIAKIRQVEEELRRSDIEFVSSNLRTWAGKKIIDSGSFQSQDGHSKTYILRLQMTRYDRDQRHPPSDLLSCGYRTQFTSINRDEHEITEAYWKDKRAGVENDMSPKDDDDSSDDPDVKDVKASGSDSGSPSDSDSDFSGAKTASDASGDI
ncbi:hypothetical protein BYT27DRAFT_7263818 [Phlegmacium glaucopus]|nr:hypothetical protein BYT27DRAFT_7263818 [Phlegmacium glaucopus]